MTFEPITWYGKDENGNVPEGAPAMNADNLNRIESGIAANKELSEANKAEIDLRAIPISLYLSFANGNANMISAAFGQGNEDDITGVGKALAMYAWFKGTDKTAYPFVNLQNLLRLSDLNHNVYGEIMTDDYLSGLVISNTYARGKLCDVYSVTAEIVYGNTFTSEETKEIVVTNEDLSHPFRLSFNLSVSTGSSNKGNAEVYINGVKVSYKHVGSSNATGSLGESGINVLKNWSDYNIETPGTYIIKAYCDKSITSASCNASITVYKAKQQYGA